MNDEGFFMELLEAFIMSQQEKTEALTITHDQANWEDYTTYVHALKSSARTIGADKLSKMAQTQENAGKDRNIPLIEDGYSPMMEEYGRVIAELRDVIGSLDEKPSTDSDDPDIMEFFPE